MIRKLKAITTLQNTINKELVILHAYLKNVERDIRNQGTSYYNKIDIVEIGKSTILNIEIADTRQEFEGIDGSCIDFERMFEETFPRLQRISAFITAFGFFEDILIRFCESVRKELMIARTLKKITGDNDLDKAINFLTEQLGISFDKNTTCYKEILKVKKIRNIFTHRSATVDQNDKQNTQFINEFSFLSTTTAFNIVPARIEIEEGFLDYCFSCFQNILNYLLDCCFEKK